MNQLVISQVLLAGYIFNMFPILDNSGFMEIFPSEH